MMQVLSRVFFLSWMVGATSFSAMAPMPALPLEDLFAMTGKLVPEDVIQQQLDALDRAEGLIPDPQQDLLAFAKLNNYMLDANRVQILGLVALAERMLQTGDFFRNYQKMILSALLDFKKYSVNGEVLSLKPGAGQPVLFIYQDEGENAHVTTYGFIHAILREAQKNLLDPSKEAYYFGVAGKVKNFLLNLLKTAERD
jgi:hypothetical protein